MNGTWGVRLSTIRPPSEKQEDFPIYPVLAQYAPTAPVILLGALRKVPALSWIEVSAWP